MRLWPDDILEFTTDPATSKTKLTLIAGGTHLNTVLGITGTGDITEQSGFADLIAPVKRPVEGKANYAYGIFITPTDQGLYLNGYVYSTRIGANHLLARWDALEMKPKGNSCRTIHLHHFLPGKRTPLLRGYSEP